MEVKSISECLNRDKNLIVEKSSKFLVKGELEDIRKHIEWKQTDVVAIREYFEARAAVLSLLSQINHIIETFY